MKLFTKKLFGLFLLFTLLNVRVLLASQSVAANNSQWLEIAYCDLVDRSTIIRTGQPLFSVLGVAGLKAAMQPLLDKYSYLLEYAVELVNNDVQNYKNIVDLYPLGTRQPAWVALFRSGMMSAFSDNNGHVRLYLQGKDPQTTYYNNYSVVRHMLNTVKPAWGSLRVEVYAFENIYAKLELRLNPVPFVIKGTYFGLPAGKVPLDLSGLADFFRQGGQLEGASMGKDGLHLFAKEGDKQTLAGQSLSLSDLAVAYRAVFHAGENKAFISLDPHIDVTKAKVNFGGLLEDTRIGSVVLEADKRFKTITSGLDPNTNTDIREYTRQYVPHFLTMTERDFLGSEATKGWVKTRFWFYPDSIEVQADESNRWARIVNPHFLADAERSRDDFNSLAEFEKKKKSMLLPSIRTNIEDINKNYEEYAQAFLELRELLVVGRIMAICSWLQKTDTSKLDMDGLLAVELPSMRTQREREQMVLVTYLSTGNYQKNMEVIKKNMQIYFLTPELSKSLKEVFSDAQDLAGFLSLKNVQGESKMLKEQAQKLWSSPKRVRDVIQTRADLEAFAMYKANILQAKRKKDSELTSIEKTYKELSDTNDALGEYVKKIGQLQESLKAQAVVSESAMVELRAITEKYNDLVNKHQAQVEVFNQRVSVYNSNFNRWPVFMEIGGGINLESQYFKITKVKDSQQLNAMKEASAQHTTHWKTDAKEEKWITNKVASSAGQEQQKGRLVSKVTSLFKMPQTASKPNVKQAQPQIQNVPQIAKVKPIIAISNQQRVIYVSSSEEGASKIRGEMVNANRIVFKKNEQ